MFLLAVTNVAVYTSLPQILQVICPMTIRVSRITDRLATTRRTFRATSAAVHLLRTATLWLLPR
jgi:hypothetical protein